MTGADLYYLSDFLTGPWIYSAFHLRPFGKCGNPITALSREAGIAHWPLALLSLRFDNRPPFPGWPVWWLVIWFLVSGVVGVECMLGLQTKAGCSLPSSSPQRGDVIPMPDDALEYRVRVAAFATMRGYDVGQVVSRRAVHRLIGQRGQARFGLTAMQRRALFEPVC
jgi:hypothetical protein